MDFDTCKDLARDAIRYFFHGNQDDDNAFVKDNLYRMRYFDTHEQCHSVHYDVGCICFDHDFAPRLDCYNALIKYLKQIEA